MKYVYLVETNSDNACHDYNGYDFEYYLNNQYWKIFKTKNEAKEYMVWLKNLVKQKYSQQVGIERARQNTITIDLLRYEINDDKDFFDDKAVYLSDLWDYEHYLIDSRYICGRY